MRKTISCILRIGVILPIILSYPSHAEVELHRRIDLSSHSVKDCRLSLGDLNGDGLIDFVFNDGRRALKAFDHQGQFLWERLNTNDPGVRETYHNFSIAVYDIDLDGMDEVICFQELNGSHVLAILDGETGSLTSSVKLPFPAPRDHPFWGNTNYYMQNHIAVANLRGLNTPQDILAIHASKQKIAAYAYDAGQLKPLWTWITDTDGYASGHYAYPYDIDDDGKDEVLAGVDVLDEHGSRLWRMELYPSNPSKPNGGMDHVDALSCADIDPDSPGKEIVVAAATGIWMFTVAGEVLWHYPSRLTDPINGLFNGEGIQEVLVGNFREDIRGLECVFFSEQMSGENTVALFAANGQSILSGDQKTGPRRNIAYAIDWDGNRELDEMYTRKGIFDGQFSRLSYSMNWNHVESVDRDEFPPVICDVHGDHREEIIWYDENEILIISNAAPLNGDILPSPRHALAYRVRMANDHHCNAMFIDWLGLMPDRDTTPPNPPGALSCVNRTDSTLTFEWLSPPQAADGDTASFYRVFRDDQLVATVQPSRFIDRGLNEATAYRYHVIAVDDDLNTSQDSASAVFETLHITSDRSFTPDAALTASIFTANERNANQLLISVTLSTSTPVIKVPSPLILQTSDSAKHAIAMQGAVPGHSFSGKISTFPLPEGSARFLLPENSLIDGYGRMSHAIIEGLILIIDRTPPTFPRQIYVQRRRSGIRGRH